MVVPNGHLEETAHPNARVGMDRPCFFSLLGGVNSRASMTKEDTTYNCITMIHNFIGRDLAVGLKDLAGTVTKFEFRDEELVPFCL